MQHERFLAFFSGQYHTFSCPVSPRYGICQAPNKRIGGSGSLACHIPCLLLSLAAGCTEFGAYANLAPSPVAFFQTLLLLAFFTLWQLLLSALPSGHTPIGRLIPRLNVQPPLQMLLPLGNIGRPAEVHFRFSGPVCRRTDRVRSTSWATSLRFLALLSCLGSPSGHPWPR